MAETSEAERRLMDLMTSADTSLEVMKRAYLFDGAKAMERALDAARPLLPILRQATKVAQRARDIQDPWECAGVASLAETLADLLDALKPAAGGIRSE